MSNPPTDAVTVSPSSAKMFAPILIDLVAPAAVYYILRTLEVGDLVALSIGALIPAARILYGVARERKVDKLAVFVLILAATGIAASLISGSAKLVLARESAFTGVAGIWCLLTLVRGKPLTYYSVRPFVTRGRAARDQAWDGLWDTSPEFRSILRALAVAWGSMFVIDSIARLFVVYAFKVEQAAFAVQLPGLALFAIVLIFTRRSGSRLRGMLDEASAGT